MKALLDVETDRQASMAEADLALRIQDLFAACPDLCGFVVQGLDGLHSDVRPRGDEGRLLISEVSFATPLDEDETLQVCTLIASAMEDLVDAQPQAYALLHGRTFARALH